MITHNDAEEYQQINPKEIAKQIFQKLGGKAVAGGFLVHCPCSVHKDRDKNPSLSVSLIESKNGYPLLKCHAGGMFEDVVQSLRVLELWPTRKLKTVKWEVKTRNTALYVWQKSTLNKSDKDLVNKYFNSRGIEFPFELLPVRVSRYKGKTSLVFQMTCSAGKLNRLYVVDINPITGEKLGKRLIGSNLTETALCFGRQEAQEALVFEGLEDALSCRQVEPDRQALSVVTGGTSGFRYINNHVIGKKILVFLDPDEHQQSLKASLVLKGDVVRLLPELDYDLNAALQKGTVRDWFQGLKEVSLPEVQNNKTAFKDYGEPENDAPQQREHMVPASEVIEQIGKENILYTENHFWRWQEETGVWAVEHDSFIKKLIHRVDGLVMKSSNINSVLELVRTECFYDSPFAGKTNAINCKNVELHYGSDGWEAKPHSRESYFNTQIPVAFDEDAKAPRFESFLDEVFAGDSDSELKKLVILELIGYTLVSSTEFEKYALLMGKGANGKSVLLSILKDLCGPRNVSAVSPTELDNKFQRAHLNGKLANIITEVKKGSYLADSAIKSIVSGEMMTAEHKYKHPFEFHPCCTLWIASNHLPEVKDDSEGFFRRVIVVEFNNKFEGANCDVNLKKKLRDELPGILNLALRAFAAVLQRGHFSDYFESNQNVKRDWRYNVDHVEMFLEEEAELVTGAVELSAHVYQRYEAWIEASGVNRKLSKQQLSIKLKEHGILASKGAQGRRVLKGLALKVA